MQHTKHNKYVLKDIYYTYGKFQSLMLRYGITLNVSYQDNESYHKNPQQKMVETIQLQLIRHDLDLAKVNVGVLRPVPQPGSY